MENDRDCSQELEGRSCSQKPKDEGFFTTVILGGGGVRGFLELGVLAYMEDKGLLQGIKTYVGVSVGSIISLLLLSGYSVKEIVIKSTEINLLCGLDSLTELLQTREKMGLLSSEPVRRVLRESLIKKFGIVPTLRQLYLMTGLKFVSVAYNLDDRRSVHFSYENEPDMSCIAAVLLSMNIPLVFHMAKYKGQMYIDGGLHDPYPFLPYDKEGELLFGIYIDYKVDDRYDLVPASGMKNVLIYLNKIWSSITRMLRDKEVEKGSDRCYHMLLYSSVADTTGITTGIDEKAKMVVKGYRRAREYFE
jgi:predicted acylesterase/phospholipase RssA